MKKQNTGGFSMVMALLLTVIMILLVLYILEYMIPYSKNVKGVENSTNAFYQTESGIEESLYFIKGRTELDNEISQSMPNTSVGIEYNTTSSGSEIPAIINGIQEGNSSFSGTFNTISVGNPIQLEVGGGMVNWNNTEFRFKVPNIEGENYTLSGGVDLPIINWQLSGDFDTLNASGSWLYSADIDGGIFSLNGLQGKNLSGSGTTNQRISNSPGSFYFTNCTGTSSGCILKMSVINDLESTTGVKLPYLEYKIDFGSNIPLRFSRIKSIGKSYGFQKTLEVRIPQQTTNEAFDFTVFQ